MADICRDWLTDQPTNCCCVVISRPRHPTILCSTAKNRSSWSAIFVGSYRCCQLFTFTGLARRIFIYIRCITFAGQTLFISFSCSRATKIQNLGSGPTPSPIIVDSNTVDPGEEFTYLGSIQSSKSNSRPEYIRRIGLAASALKRLDCVWSQSKLSITTKLRI